MSASAGVLILIGFFTVVISVFIMMDEFRSYRNSKKKNGAIFTPGNKVTAFGNFGKVKSVSNGFVIVKFDECESTVVFNEDGKLMKWHKEVSLKHV